MARSEPSLARLRELRVPRERSAALGAEVERLRADLARCRRAGKGVGAAWEQVVPPGLSAKTTVVGLFRGVLTVRVRDSSARFEIDRFLRSGGEAALARASPAPIKRVRLLG